MAWCVGILIEAYALAMATYHHKIAQSVSGGWGEQKRQGGRLGPIGLGVDSRQDDQAAVQPGPEVAGKRFDHDRRIGSEGRSTPVH